MKPMDIDACRALVQMFGGAPQCQPIKEWERFDEDKRAALNHPLQQWVDQLPPPQRQEVHLHYIGHNMTRQEHWDEAWALAIYNALWY